MQGVNVDPDNRLGTMDPQLLLDYGVTGVRIVLRPGVLDYYRHCKHAGLDICGCLANESFEQEKLEFYLANFDPDVWQLGNEMDQLGSSSWTRTTGEYLEDWNRMAPLLRKKAPVITGGLASGQPSWLLPIWERMDPKPDALAVHPYDKPAAQARWLLQQYRALYGLPLWVTEWWRPAGEIREFMAMLEDEADYSLFYCLTDGMVPGMGLFDASFQPKDSAPIFVDSIRELGVNHMGILAQLDTLKRQQGLQTEALRRLFDGEPISGGVESCQAVMYALDPKLAAENWTPRLVLPKA